MQPFVEGGRMGIVWRYWGKHEASKWLDARLSLVCRNGGRQLMMRLVSSACKLRHTCTNHRLPRHKNP